MELQIDLQADRQVDKMGILAKDLLDIHALLRLCPHGAAIMELGAQYLYIPTPPYDGYPDKYLNPSMTAPVYSKAYFEEQGHECVSIDIGGGPITANNFSAEEAANIPVGVGEGGCLIIDLCKPFDLDRKFDLVTDCGTSEHVYDLYECLRNVHNHTRVGGYIYHVNPAPGSWPGHGNWYRDPTFYVCYASLCGYNLIETHTDYVLGNSDTGWNTWATLQRGSQEFPSRELFDSLPIKRS